MFHITLSGRLRHLAIFCSILFSLNAFAQEAEESEIDPATLQLFIDSIEGRLDYQTGSIALEPGNGTLQVPAGFGFLGSTDAHYVLEELWGNPHSDEVIGLLVPRSVGVLSAHSWAYQITYDNMGYVEDDDANDIDYTELMDEMKKESAQVNEQRKTEGFEPIEFIGWASAPYYDNNAKVLHWAKEIRFGEAPSNTLNYDLRVLGRKGVFILTAIAGMEDLEEVKKHTNDVLGAVQFNDGYKYSDFVSGDKVAAYTVGGLVAGKVLAKVGFFAKFWKIIVAALAAAGAFIWKLIKGRKDDEETPQQQDAV